MFWGFFSIPLRCILVWHCVWFSSSSSLFMIKCLTSEADTGLSQFGCVNPSLSIFLAAAALCVCVRFHMKFFICVYAVFLTVWSWSCQWSTAPPVRPWACCQSLHPPEPESGTRETCNSPPAAGVWFCRASWVRHWRSERLLAPSSSCRRSRASWTWLLVAYCLTSKASNRCNWSKTLFVDKMDTASLFCSWLTGYCSILMTYKCVTSLRDRIDMKSRCKTDFLTYKTSKVN